MACQPVAVPDPHNRGLDVNHTLNEEQLRQVAPGIFYTSRPFVLVDTRIVEFLKAEAKKSGTRRARLCAHPEPASPQHDMLIVSLAGTYVAPHRHLAKTESFLIVEGVAEIALFDEQGAVTDVVTMGESGSGKPFFYRMPAGQFHSLRVLSDALVFVESTIGPFRREESEDAPWAPPPTEERAGLAYLARMIEGFGKAREA